MANDAPVVSLEGILDDFGEMSLKDARQTTVLKAFVQCLKVGEACKSADVPRANWYNWMRSDPGFRATVQQILEASTDELEMEGMRRAMEGSDQLLMFFLKTRRREKYGDKHVIEVVSPDVQRRLALTADAILQACQMDLPEPYRTNFPAKLAAKLREVWS